MMEQLPNGDIIWGPSLEIIYPKFTLLSGAKAPSKKRQTDAGWDLWFHSLKLPQQRDTNSLCAYWYDDKLVIPAHTCCKIGTGVHLQLLSYQEGKLRTRGFIAQQNLVVLGGEIDAEYTGELIVVLSNLNSQSVVLDTTKAIAQLIIISPYLGQLVPTDKLKETDRGDKGFGSTNA